ncbi:MAG: hypothetical protein J5777_07510 [Clostridiales bacterium]|nr:hypothetical protein [Clostridiales bacterium]
MAVILLVTAGLAAAFAAGCSLSGQAKEPEGASVTSQTTVPEEKSNYEKYETVLSAVEENVSKYELGPVDDRELPQYAVSGKYVYYLAHAAGHYELKRINTEDPSKSGIKQFEYLEHYCYLYPYGFRYESNDEVTFMDLELNEICRIKNTEAYEEIIPYKDTFIVMTGGDLQLLNDGKLEPFRKLKQNNFSLVTSKNTSDNTWLLFNDNNETGSFTYYIYNVGEDKYETVSDMGYNYYSGGFYDINGKRVMIRSLSDAQGQEYEAQYKGAPYNSYFDGQRIYLADPNDMTLKYYDPAKQSLCLLSEHEFGKYGVTIIGLNGNTLFVAYSQEIYTVDITNCEEIPIAEYNIILHGKIDDMETEIRDQYSINILSGEAAVKHLAGNIKSTPITDDFRIYYSVKQIYKYIKRFGKEFFKEFRYGTSQGLYVLMTGATEVTNDGAKIDAGGVAFRMDDRFYIILNINTDNTAKNFCHELMHSMEQNTDTDTLFPEWKKYNPKGFKYADSYAKASDSKYSLDGPDGYDIYFMDVYSMTNAMEDRARIFENILGVEKDECRINDLPKLKAKALYIKDRLYKLYPSLKDTDIFKNLDD